jgi:carbamate kinase
MLVVMALGGNALLRRGEPLDAEVQRRNLLTAAAKTVAPIDQAEAILAGEAETIVATTHAA